MTTPSSHTDRTQALAAQTAKFHAAIASGEFSTELVRHYGLDQPAELTEHELSRFSCIEIAADHFLDVLRICGARPDRNHRALAASAFDLVRDACIAAGLIEAE